MVSVGNCRSRGAKGSDPVCFCTKTDWRIQGEPSQQTESEFYPLILTPGASEQHPGDRVPCRRGPGHKDSK